MVILAEQNFVWQGSYEVSTAMTQEPLHGVLLCSGSSAGWPLARWHCFWSQAFVPFLLHLVDRTTIIIPCSIELLGYPTVETSASWPRTREH